MKNYRTTTVMVTIAHPVSYSPDEVAEMIETRALDTPDSWGLTQVAFVAGPQIVVEKVGDNDDADTPIWDPEEDDGE